MKKQAFTIENGSVQIPAVLWGEKSGHLLLAAHGAQSNKEDTVIALAAQAAEKAGMCTLSFDLPESGSRLAQTDYPCNPWNGRSDLLAVWKYASTFAGEISVFACSIGAYLTLLSIPDITPRQLLFLSPILSMEHLIQGMMAVAGVTEARLEAEKVIPVENGPALDWDYYCYVREHADLHCACPLAILRGGQDMLCTQADAEEFAARCGGKLTVLPAGEHYFHTYDQLAFFCTWLEKTILPVKEQPND